MRHLSWWQYNLNFIGLLLYLKILFYTIDRNLIQLMEIRALVGWRVISTLTLLLTRMIRSIPIKKCPHLVFSSQSFFSVGIHPDNDDSATNTMNPTKIDVHRPPLWSKLQQSSAQLMNSRPKQKRVRRCRTKPSMFTNIFSSNGFINNHFNWKIYNIFIPFLNNYLTSNVTPYFLLHSK